MQWECAKETLYMDTESFSDEAGWLYSTGDNNDPSLSIAIRVIPNENVYEELHQPKNSD